jgi:predicted AlkP superfamily phosphohydrolase/phosphomutase
MSTLSWDLLVVVFSLPDVWQHYYWHTLGEAGESTGRDLIHGGYELIDSHLARLLEHLPPDGLIVLCSDHGFGPLCSTRDHLNRWLAAQGFLSYRETDQQRLLSGLASTFLSQIRRRVDFRRRQRIMASIPVVRRAVETQLRMGSIDWESTHACAALDHQEVWLNLEGRQRLGCVADALAEPLAQRLRTALLDWRDGSTGLKHIKAVHLWPYAQARDHGHLAPDLLLEWNTDAAQQGLHPLISGDHDPEGALIVTGSGVCPRPLQDCSLVDIAPLALSALGVEAPESMDGRVPSGLLTGTGTTWRQ